MTYDKRYGIEEEGYRDGRYSTSLATKRRSFLKSHLKKVSTADSVFFCVAIPLILLFCYIFLLNLLKCNRHRVIIVSASLNRDCFTILNGKLSKAFYVKNIFFPHHNLLIAFSLCCIFNSRFGWLDSCFRFFFSSWKTSRQTHSTWSDWSGATT